ncbi:MAG: S41 family peptidase [Clostridiaceae bacterium]|jgi:carboxyl-terminal processing protease|nr:S41 family peptidase [Clostridiaceae bacterium]
MNSDTPHYVDPGQQQPAVRSKSKRSGGMLVLAIVLTMVLTFSMTAGIGLILWHRLAQPEQGSIDADRLSFSFSPDPDTEAALEKLQTVYRAVNERYFEELSDAELLEAMTRGLVNELDNPYTFYLSAEENEQIEESMSGQYSGIGAFVAINKENLVEVTELIENSPAEAADILIGDVFVEVNGQDVTQLNDINAVAALVRGPEGTTVDLVLYRPALNDQVAVTVERRKITTASVAHRMLEESIGYVQVREFSQHVSDNFISAVDDLVSQGADHLVIDLRNNSGGLATEVIDMLDYLLPRATLATVRGRDDGQPFEVSWDSDKQMGVPETMRYAILVNTFSASASELFSGCLRDYEKAVLIGEQTFGKGSGTITIPLDDGSAINLTNFLYYLPKGLSIEGVGLEPDQTVSLPDEARSISINRLTREQDTQLSAAIEWLENLE